ncbi:MAG: glycosyltransferase [Methanophagales archaeon]|nr:glycosyltransferase [Methanophagales archaeon]
MFKYVSIIVPVYNSAHTIEECIKSLLNLEYPKDKYEIIIVDNNSTDTTVEIVKKYPVKVLHEGKQSSYAARNLGIKNAKGEIVAFTDADCIVDEEWLKQLVKNFRDETTAGVGGEILAYHPKSIVERYSDKSGILSQKGCFEMEFVGLKLPFIATANAAYKKEILNEIGFFDDSFTSGGDVDLAWRITLKGYRIVYEPKAIVYHLHRRTLYGLFKQFFRYGEGHPKLFKKHKAIFRKKYVIDILGLLLIPYNLLLHLPFRFLTAYQCSSKERCIYIATPVFNALQKFAFKLGEIRGSIRYRVIYM